MKTEKLNLDYRENNYFNTEDYYVFEDWRLFVSKVHKHNGSWFTNEGLNFKCTSIRCVNFSELYCKRVRLKNTEIEGTVWKCLPYLDLGIGWNNGKKPFLPNFWNDINTMEFI